MIAGLSLFPSKTQDVTNPLEGMYKDCLEFRRWYCEHYQGSLALHSQNPCKKEPPFPCQPNP